MLDAIKLTSAERTLFCPFDGVSVPDSLSQSCACNKPLCHRSNHQPRTTRTHINGPEPGLRAAIRKLRCTRDKQKSAATRVMNAARRNGKHHVGNNNIRGQYTTQSPLDRYCSIRTRKALTLTEVVARRVRKIAKKATFNFLMSAQLSA
jgi:hypothetical protein